MWSRFYPPDSMFATELTLKAEHTPGGVYQDVSFLPPADLLPLVRASRPADVLRLTLRVRRDRLRYFGPLNCVSVVKAVLNLDAPMCLTPRQLHRRLLAMGATSVLEGKR